MILNPVWAREANIVPMQYNWWIREKKPDLISTKPELYRNGVQVDLLQADCDELNHIRKMFSGIPVVAGPICIWRGEIASFIFNNLPT